jgi:multiple sugar transport system permease protein
VIPLALSIFVSLSRIKFVQGGLDIQYVGFANYRKLLEGTEQRHFLGKFADLSVLGWGLLAVAIGVMLYMLYIYATRTKRSVFGFVMRSIALAGVVALLYLVLITMTGDGLPGTLVVTMIFAFGGVGIQYVIGLGLALIVVQNLPGRRFFRVIFLLPMMITPVGIGFLFKMTTDTYIGPFAPIWEAIGLGGTSWVDNGGWARVAVLIGDTWQWTPFMFIIILAALEGIPTSTIDASLVDGANRIQIFRYIILPQIIPVSTTVVMIRLIEAFKIIDLPQVLTRGGPGTATESVSLHAFNLWRAIDLGASSAVAYLLLIVVTFIAIVYVNIIRRYLLETI